MIVTHFCNVVSVVMFVLSNFRDATMADVQVMKVAQSRCASE